MAKRQKVEVDSCLFCDEKETAQHLFFDCVVAKQMWIVISQATNVHINSYDSVGAKWLPDRKFAVVNIISSAALWGLWKLRNELYFHNVGWRNMNLLIWRIVKLAQNWSIMCPPTKETELRAYISNLKDILRRPVMLTGPA